jgi:CRP-like cAMP-binding protein
MNNPWLMKMEQFTRFSETERQMLDRLASERRVQHEAGEDIISEGDHSPDCHLIVSGLACRYTILADGSRQIMAFLIPGDLCDAEIFILKEMDHSVGALTQTTTALVPADTMKGMLRGSGCLGEALWWCTMVDLATLRQRIVDHGRRDAHEQIAHLIYEMLVRYRMVGLTTGEAFDFPITQDDLADATGMTPVHVNRTLKKLRDEKLITWKGKTVTILDLERVKELSGFNPNYLHLDRAHDKQDDIRHPLGDLV